MAIQWHKQTARASIGAFAAALAVAALALPALAQQAAPAAEAQAAPAGVPEWGIASSELAADPAVRFGRLDNGMRYAIRRNAAPQGGASIRFTIDAGAREEGDEEIGAAHFLEHMAFNGSTHIPEGELIPRLERLGLAFGADTNAETGLEHMTYKLDLPRTDAATVDAALTMMREVASELTIAPAAVERERGILLSEYQTNNSPQRRRIAHFLTAALPGNRSGARLTAPPEAIAGISAEALRGFYEGYYRPEKATLIVVGDFDAAEMEARVRSAFADWRGKGKARESYAPPVEPRAAPHIAMFVDPAMTEGVELEFVSPYQPPLNTVADQRRALLEVVASLALNNRVAALTRDAATPLVGGQARFQEQFRSAESAGMVLAAKDGRWREALALGEQELRRAHQHGFTADEVAEAKANLETALTNAVTQARGQRSAVLADNLSAASLNQAVTMSPEAFLALYRAVADSITPAAVSEAFRARWPGRPTVVDVSTRTPVEGGERAIAAALSDSAQVAVIAPAAGEARAFAYDAFGPAGTVVFDTTIADLGIRTVAFANGTRLNIKRTGFEPGSIAFQMLVGNGARAFPEDKPGLSLMLQLALPEDGLKAHAPDELRRLLAGRRVSLGLGAGDEALVAAGATTPADLELQLKLLAARLTATAYRPETQALWATRAAVLIPNLRGSPPFLMGLALGYENAGNDGRAGLADPGTLAALTLEDLKAVIEPELATGAVDVALVGDVDEAAAIAAFARTLGALPPRPERAADLVGKPFVFAADRSPRTIHHEGAADQGFVALSWPTTDGHDLRSALTRELLAAVIQLRLIEKLREELGATYTPGSGSSAPPVADGFGFLMVQAAAAPDKAALVVATIRELAAELTAGPVGDDLILRARQPMLEQFRQADRQNAAWAGIVAWAQSKPDRLDRRRQRNAVLESVTADDLLAAAREYLDDEPLLVQVVPRN